MIDLTAVQRMVDDSLLLVRCRRPISTARHTKMIAVSSGRRTISRITIAAVSVRARAHGSPRRFAGIVTRKEGASRVALVEIRCESTESNIVVSQPASWALKVPVDLERGLDCVA